MRIYITGPAGSGKSTLAKQLGFQYNIPIVHLDELMWKPGWVENEDYRELQEKAISEDNWIIEGSSVSILKTLAHCVDRVIILNYHPIGNIWRIIVRYMKELFLGEKRMGWNGENKNELRFELLLNTARWRTRQLPRIRTNITEFSLEGRVLEINSMKSVFERVILELKS